MSGRKRTPCDYCEAEQFYVQDERDGHQLNVEIYPENLMIAIISFAHDECGETTEISFDLPMNFCPNCGRRLM